jgi:hypothetical protein
VRAGWPRERSGAREDAPISSRIGAPLAGRGAELHQQELDVPEQIIGWVGLLLARKASASDEPPRCAFPHAIR